jgi:hypothetical protein
MRSFQLIRLDAHPVLSRTNATVQVRNAASLLKEVGFMTLVNLDLLNAIRFGLSIPDQPGAGYFIESGEYHR